MSTYSHLSVMKINVVKQPKHYSKRKGDHVPGDAAAEIYVMEEPKRNNGEHYYRVAAVLASGNNSSINMWYGNKEYPILAD